MKKIISLTLVFLIIANTIVFADSNKNNNTLDEFIYVNEIDINCSRSNFTSNDFIDFLLINNYNFKVKDTYYQKIKKNDVLKPDQNTIELDGQLYIISRTKITDSIELTSSIDNQQSEYNEPLTQDVEIEPLSLQGDTRLREIYDISGSVSIDTKSGLYESIITQSILVIIGLSHPVGNFISSLASAIPFPTSYYGNVVITTVNSYYDTIVYHEVYDMVGFIPMVITESRRTNMTVHEDVTHKDTGANGTTSKLYNGLKYQYSLYWNELTRNLNEAVARYNAGFRNPKKYSYNTGLVIDNSAMLPN